MLTKPKQWRMEKVIKRLRRQENGRASCHTGVARNLVVQCIKCLRWVRRKCSAMNVNETVRV